MKQATMPRILIGRLVIIVVAVCGAAAGLVLGCGFALIRAGDSLQRVSLAATARENAALAEARSVLNAMQGAHSGICSGAEIADFRSFVFRSEYIKDAGRIRGGRIECSAMSGRVAPATAPFRADFRLSSSGTLVYRNLSLLPTAGQNRVALQMGSAYVVLDMTPTTPPQPIHARLAITMSAGDAARQNPGISAAVTQNPPYRRSPGSGLIGNILYATRCSNPAFSCATATTTVSRALQGESGVLPWFTTAAAMAAIFLWTGLPILDIRNHDMSRQLRQDLESGKIQVHYQPIVNLETRQIVGAEALARWSDHKGRPVNPEIFVKIAEDQGFIGLLTKAVLKRVLRDFAPTLRKRPGFRISINVGAQDLVDPEFLPMLEKNLQKAGVRPQSVVVEITERSAANGPAAKHTISTLRRLGHSIHIDDFGAGFSNLDKLLYLYADTIKIDKAFTRTIGTESVATVILPHIMTIAKSLNLEVIVEGVEITYQADYFLPGKQKIYGQGWLFGRPMTAERFLSLLDHLGVAAQTPSEGYGAQPNAGNPSSGNISARQTFPSFNPPIRLAPHPFALFAKEAENLPSQPCISRRRCSSIRPAISAKNRSRRRFCS